MLLCNQLEELQSGTMVQFGRDSGVWGWSLGRREMGNKERGFT